jgi:hypothetical protein
VAWDFGKAIHCRVSRTALSENDSVACDEFALPLESILSCLHASPFLKTGSWTKSEPGNSCSGSKGLGIAPQERPVIVDSFDAKDELAVGAEVLDLEAGPGPLVHITHNSCGGGDHALVAGHPL